MNIYDQIEQYLPEMTAIRSQYNTYLQKNHLTKTAEEKLLDYLLLISNAYTYNSEKLVSEFSTPDIATALQKNKEQSIYDVVGTLAFKMRYRPMQDHAKFSAAILKEFYKEKENIIIQTDDYWLYKRFPDYMYINRANAVRYALNIKPGIGLFKKLDDLCLKYEASGYKVVNQKQYDQRTDPIIVYANKKNQPEMLTALETLIGPYRRKDEYDAIGYQNLGNGIFIADEVKKEHIIQLKYAVLNQEELNVFLHPSVDEFEQIDRECDVIDDIIDNKKQHPLKSELVNYIRLHEYNSSLSNAQYQVIKMIVDAYNKTKNTQTNTMAAKSAENTKE